MKIFLGADHAGFALKETIKKDLMARHEVTDLGNKRFVPTDDYPDFARKVAEATVRSGGIGLLFCDTGEGMAVAANKIPGTRAVAAGSDLLVRRARQHENANILCLGNLVVTPRQAKRLVHVFLATPPSRAERHVRRRNKISELEQR